MACHIISKTHELFCSFINNKLNIKKKAQIACSESPKKNTCIPSLLAYRKEEGNSDLRALPVPSTPTKIRAPGISFPSFLISAFSYLQLIHHLTLFVPWTSSPVNYFRNSGTCLSGFLSLVETLCGLESVFKKCLLNENKRA